MASFNRVRARCTSPKCSISNSPAIWGEIRSPGSSAIAEISVGDLEASAMLTPWMQVRTDRTCKRLIGPFVLCLVTQRHNLAVHCQRSKQSPPRERVGMVGNEGGVDHHGRNMPKQAPHDAAVPQ